MTRHILTGAAIFDGTTMFHNHALVLEKGHVAAIVMEADLPAGSRHVLAGGTLAPGLVDLQVNGGGGLSVGGTTDVTALRQICAVHAALGATGVLPTLITDNPAVTTQVISAGIDAARLGVRGFLGLHLEGPHLDPRRHGAHDPTLIRPMQEDDLVQICDAAAQLPALMVTVAPEAVTVAQIKTMARAGVVVSLGHAECSHDQAMAAIDAGARCATHLFNAMSQLGNREPGLVGAVLRSRIYAGLIADGIHVHPTTLQLALAARTDGLFLVSDAMAIAGTNMTEFALGGRRIFRADGRLTLPDGTLAGADLSLPQAVRYAIIKLGLRPERAIAMATCIPAGLIGATAGQLILGSPADLVHFDDDWSLRQVWQSGEPLAKAFAC